METNDKLKIYFSSMICLTSGMSLRVNCQLFSLAEIEPTSYGNLTQKQNFGVAKVSYLQAALVNKLPSIFLVMSL